MNALLIQSDSSTSQDVALKSYVDSVVYVAPGAKLTSEYGNYELPNDFEEPKNHLESSDLQLAMM